MIDFHKVHRHGIDYDHISHSYDHHRSAGGPFVPALVRLAQMCDAQRVLEIGPGTGNVTAAFLEAHPCRLIGGELSWGMLSKAVAKRVSGATWMRANALAIPLADVSVDFVFACYVLQHLPDLGRALSECRRILRPGGIAAFVTTSHDYIRRHPMNRYFPSFAPIDLARFPSDETLLCSLRDAGFHSVEIEIASEPRPIDRAYADKVANRFISTYDLIPESEFQEGVKRLYSDLEETGNIQVEYGWEALIVHGQRAAS